MYAYIRPLLFALEAEKAHALTLSTLHYLPAGCFAKISPQIVNVMGIEFPHRVGLAAGLDKNADHLDALAKLGFAYIEVGTVTPRPQMGNTKPRLFRIPTAQALINRMGFNNHGVDNLVNNIARSDYQGVLGINIGKNKETSLNQATEDYLYCLRKVYSLASYVAINVSSPNTPDLRQLQQEGYFAVLLQALRTEQLHLADRMQRYVPLVVKISPDETPETLKKIAAAVLACGIDGIIATNTTCARAAIQGLTHADEQGGLSGRPLFVPATACLARLKQEVGDAVTLIGVGGIDDVTTARAKLAAGASLLQVYTGLIYQGPQFVKTLVDGLSDYE